MTRNWITFCIKYLYLLAEIRSKMYSIHYVLLKYFCLRATEVANTLCKYCLAYIGRLQNNCVKNTKCSLHCNCTFIFLQIAIASKLQGELIRQGLDPFASKVVMDTVPYTSYIRDVHHYNGINKALKSLVTTSSKWHFRPQIREQMSGPEIS